MEPKTLSDKKIPILPTEQEFYLPADFLLEIIKTLDFKIKILCTTVGYGFVNLRIPVYRGKVANVYYNDEISMKVLVDHFFPKEDIGKTKNKEEFDTR